MPLGFSEPIGALSRASSTAMSAAWMGGCGGDGGGGCTDASLSSPSNDPSPASARAVAAASLSPAGALIVFPAAHCSLYHPTTRSTLPCVLDEPHLKLTTSNPTDLSPSLGRWAAGGAGMVICVHGVAMLCWCVSAARSGAGGDTADARGAKCAATAIIAF
eukprot:4679087-Prymnesium_polylepis.1